MARTAHKEQERAYDTTNRPFIVLSPKDFVPYFTGDIHGMEQAQERIRQLIKRSQLDTPRP